MSLAGIDRVLPMQEIAGAPKDRIAIVAAHNTFHAIGTTIIATMVMVSTLGCNNCLVLADGKVHYTMANAIFYLKKPANEIGMPCRNLHAGCSVL